MAFKKGKSGNKSGRPKDDNFLKMAKQFNREFVEVKLVEFLRKPIVEIEELLKDKSKDSIDHFIGRIVLMGVVAGDHHRLNFMFDRIIGKVPSTVQMEGSQEKPLTLNYSLKKS